MAANDIKDANRKGRGRGFGRGRGLARGSIPGFTEEIHAEGQVGVVDPPPPSKFVPHPVQVPVPTRVPQPLAPMAFAAPRSPQAAGPRLMGPHHAARNGDVGAVAAGVEMMRVGGPPRGASRGRDGDRSEVKKADDDYDPNEGDVS